MRCLIGFFGLTRSLRHTAGSIHDAFYEPLLRAGIPVLSAGHFNLPDTIDNPRSGEFGIIPDRTESSLLNLDLCWIEPQARINVETPVAVGRAFPDGFGDGYRSLENLVQQLRSLERLWTMLQLFGVAGDDLLLLLRPDLFYFDRLDPIRDLRPILDGSADLIVPGWQGWGGLNDRFAFCNRRGAQAYATRLAAFLDGCLAMGGMHSERFLQFVAQRQGLRVAHTSLRAARVRANGQIARNDAGLLASQWQAQPAAAA
jgi:hypothetical protein